MAHVSIPCSPRWGRILILPTLLALVVACGGSGGQSFSSSGSNDEFATFSAANVTASSTEQDQPLLELMASNGLTATEWVDQFNQAITAVFKTQNDYLRNTLRNHDLLNAIDARLLAANLAVIYQASDDLTRNELEQFWFDIAGVNGQLQYLDELYSAKNTDKYEANSLLWTQHDHLFKQNFIDWIYNELNPASITGVDFEASFYQAHQTIKKELDIDLPFTFAGNETHFVHVATQLLDAATFTHNSIQPLSAVFQDAGGRLNSMSAIELKGDYRQSQRPEGTTTLVPIKNTELLLAIIQPAPSQYDYYLSELPSMLRETLSGAIEPRTAYLPIMKEARYGHSQFDALLASRGVTQLFDTVLADLTNMDAGGQYVSYFQHDYKFTVDQNGLSFDSTGVVSTTISPESAFLNEDNNNGSGFLGLTWTGSSFTVDAVPPCLDIENPYIFNPLLLAVVDAKSGAIVYLLDIEKGDGGEVVDCGI